jgi:hypothetical protein
MISPAFLVSACVMLRCREGDVFDDKGVDA